MLKLFKSKKFILIAGILILALAGTAGGVMLMKKKAHAPSQEEGEPGVGQEIVDEATHGSETKDGESESGHGTNKKESSLSKKDLSYQFDKFNINLLDPRGRWFIIIMINVEAASAKVLREIEDNVVPLRDATIMLLSGKKPEEVQTPDGKEQLRRELLARYEGVLKPGAIKNIYFSDFIVTPR